jgi:hypothetical protein
MEYKLNKKESVEKDNYNRNHGIRCLKKVFFDLNLDEKHELGEDIWLGAAIFNSLIYIGDSLQELKNAMIAKELV